MDVGGVRLECWSVRDTGLLVTPARFRRLGGLVRHHRAPDEAWPDPLVLRLDDDRLHVEGFGSWPLAQVSARRLGGGPPAIFVLEVPAGARLLACAPGPGLDSLLAALG